MKAEGAVADEADLAVEAFEAAVGESEADRDEDAVAVLAQRAGEPTKGVSRERDARRRPVAGTRTVATATPWEVQRVNRRLYRAFLLREELRLLYDLPDPALAPAHFDAWLAQ